MTTLPRRQFLQTAGYLSIGFTLFGCTSKGPETALSQKENFSFEGPTGPLPDDAQIDAWLQILEDGSIQILTGRMELGQGVIVVMQQVAGEELNTHPSKIQVVLADTGRTPNEGYTAGSRAVERGAMSVRKAAAAARQKLLDLAAEKWSIPIQQLNLDNGQVVRKDIKEQFAFHELLENQQLSEQFPDDVVLKPKSAYQWVGRPIPHPNMEKIVRGAAMYVQDLRFPEMVHARVVRPLRYGATIKTWDSAIEHMPGVLKIVQNGSFLAVIAEEEFAAIKALEILQKTTSWTPGKELPNVNSWSEYMLAATGEKFQAENTANTHHAVYSKPYIMHGSIGPSCAVAAFKEGRLHIWSHTQGVYPLRSTLSDMTGLAEDAIRVTGMPGSGCYGHNGADDVAADAALLAIAFPGRPVRLQWQREDEHLWEPYGSAMRMELSAQLNTRGKIESWTYHLWSDGHSTRPRGNAANLLAARYLDEPFHFNGSNRVGGGTRNAEPYYKFPHTKMEDHFVEGPLRTSALRSLGAYANIFAIESFMEELAEKTGQHPLDFRIRHLEDDRAIVVLQELRKALEKETVDAGQGIGYGFSRYKNTASYCAVAAKVQVDLPAKLVRPLKMWAILDAGEAINPDGLKNQTEGGMIQAASWTLKEEVLFDSKGISSKNWINYPILRYDVIPETEVIIIDRPDQPPLGAGEAAQGPAGAAIANAVYQACDKRVRELPIERQLF